jgi:hypothetical protein
LRIEGDVPGETLKHPSTIKVIFNGKLLDQVVAKTQSIRLEYLIPADQQGSGAWSELRLVFDQAVVPSQLNPQSTDARRLSFSLQNLVWEEPPSAK